MTAGSWWSSHLSICQQKFSEKRASLNCEMSLLPQACTLAEPGGLWRLKSYYFHANHMLGALDFTSSEHWAPLNFS